MKSCDVQFIKVFLVVVQFIGVLIYALNMSDNAPEETVIVFTILDIKDSLFVQGLGRLYVRPRSDGKSGRAETYHLSLDSVLSRNATRF